MLTMAETVYVQRESIWELSVLSAQFFCKPKPALKNICFFKKKGKENGLADRVYNIHKEE